MGPYDQDNATVTTGDLPSPTYWQAKFAHLKLEAAVASGQPEQAVAGIVPDVTHPATRLLRTYPNHREVMAWREQALALAAGIDPAGPPAGAVPAFRPDFDCWNDHAYGAGWRAYHLARTAAANRDVRVALNHAREAATQLTLAAARMGGWPLDVRRFVLLALAEMTRFGEQVRTRLSA